MKEKERSVSWLARKINCDNGNLGRQLRTKYSMQADLILEISFALETNFFDYYFSVFNKNSVKITEK
ncbi:MAG: hypothetical protein FWC39_01250 [Bacteroidetes bacterium]|nr:hypothetical protein [Bacteroidota bacterium]